MNTVYISVLSLLFISFIACCYGWQSSSGSATPSLAITMICRDEAVNFKTNLPGWLDIVDYFVFLLDERTTDDSVEVIRSILSPVNKDYVIRPYNFTGFGPARTLSLETTWEKFPQASHVLIADPDWIPDISTMDIYDLADPADVFRFTAYDRNGYTKRRMDWLLRHREGLAMRYNLHEVLDIGHYNVKSISWEVREVEKPGSWHTTVGHQNSMSAERYKFDLALLYKDLDLYYHDPHTHYYLGVTHEAYANKLIPVLGLHHPEVQRNLDQGIKYLELRATTLYDDEFVEQRWAVMLQLGVAYTYTKRDDLKAIYWLNMCRDYKPSHSECALALCQMHMKLGQLSAALVEIHAVLQLEHEERQMLEYLNQRDCKIPAMALHIFASKATVFGLEADEAMYFVLLWQMTQSESCGNVRGAPEERLQAIVNAAIGHGVNYFHSNQDVCADPTIQQYLLRNKYTVHPCEQVQNTQQYHKSCSIFTGTAPPAYEDFQVGMKTKCFVGAAILPDILHHAFQGHAATFLTPAAPAPKALRFLFAEHFHPEMLFNLLGQLQRLAIQDFEVVVVTPDSATINIIQDRLQACRLAVSIEVSQKVAFHEESILAFAAGRGLDAPLYNYIEYNAGISKAAEPEAELSAVSALLLPGTGVMGLTYFTRNHHVHRLRSLVDKRNLTAMIPFSLEATRLVRTYLDQHRMGALKDDHELVTHLGGEADRFMNVRYKLSEALPRAAWRVYSQSEVEELTAGVGLTVASWVPSAYAKPFDEIEHFEVQKHAATGMSQQHYLQELMASFRYTLYLVKPSSSAAANLSVSSVQEGKDTALLYGRLKLTRSHFHHSLGGRSQAANIYIVDRVGYLGSSLQNMEQLALQRQSTSLEFAHYALPGGTRFGFILSPVIAPCLPQLSAQPSLQSLHDINRQFAAQQRRDFDEVEAQELLLQLLSYLEKLNLIAYEARGARRTTGPEEEQKVFTQEQQAWSPTSPATSTSSATSGNSKRIGGLKVTNKKPSSDSPATTTTPTTGSDNSHTVGRLTALQIEKNPESVKKLLELGHTYEQIEEVLLSEARRQELIQRTEVVKDIARRTGKAQTDTTTGSTKEGKARTLTEHLERLKING